MIAQGPKTVGDIRLEFADRTSFLFNDFDTSIIVQYIPNEVANDLFGVGLDLSWYYKQKTLNLQQILADMSELINLAVKAANQHDISYSDILFSQISTLAWLANFDKINFSLVYDTKHSYFHMHFIQNIAQFIEMDLKMTPALENMALGFKCIPNCDKCTLLV